MGPSLLVHPKRDPGFGPPRCPSGWGQQRPLTQRLEAPGTQTLQGATRNQDLWDVDAQTLGP